MPVDTGIPGRDAIIPAAAPMRAMDTQVSAGATTAVVVDTLAVVVDMPAVVVDMPAAITAVAAVRAAEVTGNRGLGR